MSKTGSTLSVAGRLFGESADLFVDDVDDVRLGHMPEVVEGFLRAQNLVISDAILSAGFKPAARIRGLGLGRNFRAVDRQARIESWHQTGWGCSNADGRTVSVNGDGCFLRQPPDRS
jgi:hypothetical protein